MRAHQLGREQERGAAVDVVAVVGVDAVRGPDALGPLDDAEVDPATTPKPAASKPLI